MKIKHLLLVLAAVGAAPAFAQALGTVTSVSGVATVTTGTSGTAVTVGAPIVSGSRVVTTSNSSVTLTLNNGCVVTVPPSSGVTVLSTQTCDQLRAGVVPVTTTVQTTTTTTRVPVAIGPFGGNTAGIAALLLGTGLLAAAGGGGGGGGDQPISGR